MFGLWQGCYGLEFGPPQKDEKVCVYLTDGQFCFKGWGGTSSVGEVMEVGINKWVTTDVLVQNQ